jgi:hypothetical protein
MSREGSLPHTFALPKSVDSDLGPDTAGQSGDTQGLPDTAIAGDQSVKELVEQGQSFEADVLLGVEDALDEGVSEVHTHEVLEDDVPAEYRDVVESPRSGKD